MTNQLDAARLCARTAFLAAYEVAMAKVVLDHPAFSPRPVTDVEIFADYFAGCVDAVEVWDAPVSSYPTAAALEAATAPSVDRLTSNLRIAVATYVAAKGEYGPLMPAHYEEQVIGAALALVADGATLAESPR